MMTKILHKYTTYMKNSVIPHFISVKRLFMISFIYNVFTILMIYGFSLASFKDKTIIAVASFLSYYVIWGIVCVIMMGQTVERQLPLIKSKYIMKPGRYVQVNNIYWEIKTRNLIQRRAA